ncbi:hypothetical protein KR222_002993, partial [Zaprionus bogoriensis]
MNWPGKSGVAAQYFGAHLPAAAAERVACSTDCTCKCKCCRGLVQKYIDFDAADAGTSAASVQKMVRFSTSDMLQLVHVAQGLENFWSNQYYKVDLLPDFKVLSAVFGAQRAPNAAQLAQIMDTITTGYRRAVARLSASEACAVVRPKAAAASYPGLRCDCEHCELLPWRNLKQLQAHQSQHKLSDNFHCCLCYRRYFIQHALLSHLSRRSKGSETGPLEENASYKQLQAQQLQQEQLEQAETPAAQVEKLDVLMPMANYLDFEAELGEERVPPAPRKLCLSNGCARCGHVYMYSFSHQLHMRQHHTPVRRRWHCASCTRCFRTRRVYLQHQRCVRASRLKRLHRYKCSLCWQSFLLKSSIRTHMAQVHVRSYTCLICKQPAPTRCCTAHGAEQAKAALRQHLERLRVLYGRPKPRSGPKPGTKARPKPSCSQCQRQFPNNFLLGIHVKRVHLKQADFTCDQCGRTFYSRKEVQEHIRKVHLVSDSVECKVCGVIIKDRGNYQRHCESVRHLEALNK